MKSGISRRIIEKELQKQNELQLLPKKARMSKYSHILSMADLRLLRNNLTFLNQCLTDLKTKNQWQPLNNQEDEDISDQTDASKQQLSQNFKIGPMSQSILEQPY